MGKYGIFPIMGNAGFISSTVVSRIRLSDFEVRSLGVEEFGV